MQKSPQAQGMVSIISHYLGYWTKRTDIASQGMFCNQLQILLHDFPLAKPRPVPWVIPFLGWAQILQEPCHGTLTEQKGTVTTSCSGGNVRSEKTCLGTSKGETCWGSESDLCNFTHMENFITSKEQRSWKTEMPHIPTLWLQGALHCLALGISLMYYFIFQIFLTVLNLEA